MRWIWVNYFQRMNRQESSLTIWPISPNATNPTRKNYCDAKLKTNSLWHFSSLKHLDRFFPHLTTTHLQPVLCGAKNNPVLSSWTSRISSWTRSFHPCSPDRQELRKFWLSTEVLLNQTYLESCFSKEKNWSEVFFFKSYIARFFFISNQTVYLDRYMYIPAPNLRNVTVNLRIGVLESYYKRGQWHEITAR